MIGQFVNIYAAISVFEPVALSVFERFVVNHLALNSLFYSVIHLTANWKSLTRPERRARRCVSLLLFFFADPLEKHWISVWGFNRYAKNISRNRPGNLVELNWQKWKLDAGCVHKCVIICIADGGDRFRCCLCWCIYVWKIALVFHIFVLVCFDFWEQWFSSWPWPKIIYQEGLWTAGRF